MRLCENENVYVYEASGDTMSELLKNLANAVPAVEEEGSYISVSTYLVDGEGYMATVYVHV